MGIYYTLRRNDSNCHIFEFNPEEERLDVTIGTRYKLEKLSAMNGEPHEDETVVAKMNGGFFNMNGSSEYLGTFVDEGLYYNGSLKYYPTLIFWKNNKRLTVEHDPTQKRCSEYQRDAYFAIGVPWTLVINGVADYTYPKETLISVFGHPYQRAPRTMIGQKKDGTIVWVVVDGRSSDSSGFTIIHSSTLMIELGCEIAVNLDGGGSSEMIIHDSIVNEPSGGMERKIGTAFMCYSKLKVEETPYRAIGRVTNVEENDVLNVRQGPGTSYSVIGRIKNNTDLEVVAYNSTGKWYKITYTVDNVTYSGWVNKYYVEEKYVVTINDYTPYMVVRNDLPKDIVFRLVGQTDTEYIVIYNGKEILIDKNRMKML